MQAGAFVGRGTNLNITEHQLGGHRLADSALVSFSRTEAGTVPIRGSRDGFIYHTDNLAAHNTFDVADLYKPSLMAADVHAQQEIATTRLGLADITKVYDTKRNKTIRWPFTPRSDLAVSDFES